MFLLWLCFANDESVPVFIHTQDEVSGFGGTFYWMVQLDFDASTQLLRDRKMLATLGKREVCFMLSELDGMPPIRFLETGEPNVRDTQLFGCQISFESLTQSIREHLDGRSGNVFPTTCKLL